MPSSKCRQNQCNSVKSWFAEDSYKFTNTLIAIKLACQIWYSRFVMSPSPAERLPIRSGCLPWSLRGSGPGEDVHVAGVGSCALSKGGAQFGPPR